jgi:hypothetical protein
MDQSSEPKTDPAPGFIERMRRHKLVILTAAAASVLACIFTFISGADSTVHIVRGYLYPAPGIKLVQFALSDPDHLKVEDPILAVQNPADAPDANETITTYESGPRCEHARKNNPCRAIFQASFQNLTDHDVSITEIRYVVTDFGEVAGTQAGPLQPATHYSFRLDWAKGTQTQILVPPFAIPAKSQGAFDLEIAPKEEAMGAAWLMHIEFVGSDGTVKTDRFQFIP